MSTTTVAPAAMGSGRELAKPPSDGISNLRFSNHSNNLLVSSWDKTVRLYDADANLLKGEFVHPGAVLDCCFHDDSSGFSAGADHAVRRLVFNSSKEDVLGCHDGPVRCVEYSYSAGQVITGSWDKTVKCWDPRGVSGPERMLVGTYTQPERVYSMSLVGNRLVVAMAGRHVNIYDLRNMSQPEQKRDSSLKYQTRCVRCFPNGTGYALSSVEGRVSMEFFDLSESAQSRKYAFKCHRKSEAGRDTVYPVNAIAFHPIYGTFATGGCDGFVNVWDGTNKKRLYQYSKYASSIAALSFSKDGHLLAVASSYTYEEGEKSHEPDAIFIRAVNEVEGSSLLQSIILFLYASVASGRARSPPRAPTYRTLVHGAAALQFLFPSIACKAATTRPCSSHGGNAVATGRHLSSAQHVTRQRARRWLALDHFCPYRVFAILLLSVRGAAVVFLLPPESRTMEVTTAARTAENKAMPTSLRGGI